MTSGSNGYEERHYSAQDGLTLYFRDYGEADLPGTPLLCLPGLTRNSKDFHDLALRYSFSPNERSVLPRRVICPDLRGRGRSAYDPDWRNYRPEIYLGDLFHLLTLCNLHGVIVCGTSMGGLLAMALAVLAPTMVRAVVLNDIGPDIESSGSNRILRYVGEDQPQPDWPSAMTKVKQLFPGIGYTSEEDWLGVARSTFREGDDGQLHFDWDVALARQLTADRARFDLWAYYRALGNRPTLALRGETSDILSPATLAAMSKVKPDLAVTTIPGVGHTPTLDEPQSLEALDALFLRTDRSRRTGH